MLVNRKVQTDSGNVVIFGELEDVDRIYKCLVKAMIQSGYQLHLIESKDNLGFPDPPSDDTAIKLSELQASYDLVLRDFMGVMAENEALQEKVAFQMGRANALQQLLDNLQ